MVVITIVTGAYKPTNVTGGAHIAPCGTMDPMGYNWAAPTGAPNVSCRAEVDLWEAWRCRAVPQHGLAVSHDMKSCELFGGCHVPLNLVFPCIVMKNYDLS